MLIEQIIVLELREPGPPGRTCARITGYFRGKTKIFKATLWVDYYVLLKYCAKQCTLITSPYMDQITKFNSKMQEFECLLDLNCK